MKRDDNGVECGRPHIDLHGLFRDDLAQTILWGLAFLLLLTSILFMAGAS